MTYPAASFEEDQVLTQGVLSRRCMAWVIDIVLIAILCTILWSVLALFGVLTLGLGLPLLGILPLVPFSYNLLFLASPMAATPGQSMMGLGVRRNDDLGRPDFLQALVSTVVYYVTLATSGLLLLIALVTVRRRTLHDLASGLVVVRVAALTPPSAYWNMPDGSAMR
jgi:uncharacterized RDD family membrane protein YckC